MNSYTKNLVLLHVIVLIFGFTGILGNEIGLNAFTIVAYRMILAGIVIGIYLRLVKGSFRAPTGALLKMCGVGIIIAAHWITFFASIKESKVSVTLACMASASFFVALFEPLVTRKKVRTYELMLGIAVIIGLGIIFSFETEYALGIGLAVLSAAFAAIFGTLNSLLVKQYDAIKISFYEMLSGAAVVFAFLWLSPNQTVLLTGMTILDGVYLFLLATVATAFAFVVSVDVMRELTAFTVSLSINLEPVYSIILALLIYGESEQLSGYFYLGALIVISTLFFNAWLKRRERRRAKLLSESKL